MWSSHSYNLFICRAEENKTSATIPVQSTRWQEIEERVGEVVRGDIHVSNKKWSANFRFIEMKCIQYVSMCEYVWCFASGLFPMTRERRFFCRISPCRNSVEWRRWWESLARWVHECVCECIFAGKRNWNGSSYVIQYMGAAVAIVATLAMPVRDTNIYFNIQFLLRIAFFCFRSSFCIMIHWDLKWRHTLNERVFCTRHTHSTPELRLFSSRSLLSGNLSFRKNIDFAGAFGRSNSSTFGWKNEIPFFPASESVGGSPDVQKDISCTYVVRTSWVSTVDGKVQKKKRKIKHRIRW